MAEQLTNYLKDIMRPEVVVFIISMLPILELRGGLIAAAILHIDWYIAFPICVIGNMLPIPLELLFIRKIFELLKKIKPLKRLIEKLETRAENKGKKIEQYKVWGLFALVAIPIPGTGAWTGGLVADLLDMRIKKSMPIITVGVIAAGLIVSFISYVIPAII